jgi:hypothetical protein
MSLWYENLTCTYHMLKSSIVQFQTFLILGLFSCRAHTFSFNLVHTFYATHSRGIHITTCIKFIDYVWYNASHVTSWHDFLFLFLNPFLTCIECWCIFLHISNKTQMKWGSALLALFYIPLFKHNHCITSTHFGQFSSRTFSPICACIMS